MLRPLEASDADHIAAIWTAACGPDLAISSRFARFNTRPTTGAIQAGRLAMQAGQPVGFVSASVLPTDPDTSPPEMGWVDAIAVLPNSQRQGIGSELLAWAEEWLRSQGCTVSRLGGSLRPFAPGLPAELGAEAFFHNQGYRDRHDSPSTWDVACDLSNYQIPNLGPVWPKPDEYAKYQISNITVQATQTGQENALLDFLRREYPGRWRFEFQEFLREQGRLSDYMALWTERGMDGFARLTFEDSERPIERFYMHRLPRPWGQLGPIGVSGDCRGKGYGGALLDAGLRRLRDSGIRGCVIDWTSLVDFYGKFGFQPYRQYAVLLKPLTKDE